MNDMLELKFRELATKRFGYSEGALSKVVGGSYFREVNSLHRD